MATACHEARGLGERLGFGSLELAHLVTAVAEVAGNAWRHAGGGCVELEPVEEAGRIGLAVRVVDSGPGIPDLETAMMDGWSSAGGLGVGLPGARRLMDEFRVTARPEGGSEVSMTRWRQRAGAQPGLPLVDWASAPAPAPTGRRALVCPFGGGVLLAIVSALGSGREAELAIEAARSTLSAYPSESPIALAERCHAALASTAGAALAVASLSRLGSGLTWLALGDVGAVLFRTGPSVRPAMETAPARYGAAGRRLPPLAATTLAIAPGDTIALAAGPQVGIERPDGLGRLEPAQAARRLLGDDSPGALVLVARRR